MRILEFKEFSLNEGYRNMDILSTIKLMDVAIIPAYDPKNYETWPEHVRCAETVRMEVKDVIELVKEKRFKEALQEIDDAKIYLGYLENAIVRAMNDLKAEEDAARTEDEAEEGPDGTP